MQIAVMGCGVVGSGTVEIFEKNFEKLGAKCGEKELSVKYILDLRDFPDRPYGNKVIKDINTILCDDDVKIVVETMGGLNPAYKFVTQCLEAGKSVVTSNKELVSQKGYELLEIAKKHNVNFMFEASVCGGIPVIRPLFNCLAANEITGFAGILNGTTNFILTKMIYDKMSFQSALKLAQDNGFAEKDPTADIEGLDACRKTCILASIAFGTHIYPDEIHTEGISRITIEDVEYAAVNGAKIKLLGRAEKLPDGSIYAMVSPAFVKETSLISAVNGVNNALLVRGGYVGEVMFTGPGAGKFPTASAVAADVVDCARACGTRIACDWNAPENGKIADYKEQTVSLYIRGFAKDKKEAVEKLREAFGKIELIEKANAPENEIAFTTPSAPEKQLTEEMLSVRDFAAASVIRITDF